MMDDRIKCIHKTLTQFLIPHEFARTFKNAIHVPIPNLPYSQMNPPIVLPHLNPRI